MSKFLVIPDIHGRTYWKNVLETHNIDDYDKVVFLGDYLDPYPFEYISVESAIQNFREIIDFKSKHNDKVVLLLGNHDIYYFMKTRGNSRYSWAFHEEIESIFEDDREFFQIAFESEGTLFTHSGFLEAWGEWARTGRLHAVDLQPTAESLNSLIAADNKDGFLILNIVSEARNGDYLFGSCIWADCTEHERNGSYEGKFQVFGHSLQLNLNEYYKTYRESDIKDGKAIIRENYAMLDCRHGFVYDESMRRFFLIDNDGSETEVFKSESIDEEDVLND